MKLNIIVLLLSIAMLFSCTIQKRLYRKGFYVEFKQNNKHILTHKDLSSNNSIQTITTLLNFPVIIDTNKLNHNSSFDLNKKSTTYSFHPNTPKKNSVSFLSFNLFNPHSVNTNFILQNNKNSQRETIIKNNSIKTNSIKINSMTPSPLSNNFITRCQLVAIIFQLLIGLWIANYYMFFYLYPFYPLTYIPLVLFILTILIPSYIFFRKEPSRNYIPHNYSFSTFITLLLMSLLGFLLPLIMLSEFGGLWIDNLVINLGALPYPAWFFWLHVCSATLLLIFTAILLFLNKKDKKDKLAKESTIIDIDKNDPIFKKILFLRKIRTWLYVISFTVLILPLFLFLLIFVLP